MKTKDFVNLLTRTPQDLFWARAFPMVAMVFSPVMTVMYFTQTQQRGYYPPEADSISIPIFSFFLAWLFVAPLFVYGLFRITRHSPKSLSIVNWSKRRPATAAFYSFLALVWIVFKAYSAVCMVLDSLPYNAVYDIAWILSALWLRAYAVSSLDIESKGTEGLLKQ